MHSESDRIFVTDLSSNGTWLNARRLTPGESRVVTESDAIQIPGFEIRIEVPESDEPAEVAPSPTPPSTPESVEPQEQAQQPVDLARGFLSSLSILEKLIVTLAFLTLALIIVYLTAS